MSPEEINEAVARKLGDFEFVPAQGDSDSYWRRKSYPEFPFLPDFCHSIEAAWEIVDKYKLLVIPTDKGWLSAKQGVIEEGSGEEFWFPSNCATRDECSCGCCAIADTAPMAICLAFLKLPNINK